MAICDLTLAGCQVLTQLLLYFSSREQGRGKGWVKIKTEDHLPMAVTGKTDSTWGNLIIAHS